MNGARTRGQPAAIAAIDALLRGGVPHAILLAGPGGTGKTTLALDVAAALLCAAPDTDARPCRACRACRMLDAGNHPDLHRLAPAGAGQQIGIGGTERARGVRDLVGELVLLPVEGGARVALIEEAQRLNEEAQSALLKTLEEPPPGVVILLCAEEEERLLPTVRSRCARVRLGPVGVRDIEALLAQRGLAEPPTAARLARIAAGRPGLAVAYARAPGAEAIRGEIARRLLDLRGAGIAASLVAVRELQARAVELAAALDAAESASSASGTSAGGFAAGGSRRRGSKSAAAAAAPAPAEAAPDEGGAEVDVAPARLAAPERRRGALVLLRIWADVVRDLALLDIGEPRRVRDIGLLDDLAASLRSGTMADGGGATASPPARFLARLARAAELLDGNAAPELVLDTLAVAWGDSSRATNPAAVEGRR